MEESMIEWPYTEHILELYELEYEKALNTTYVRDRRTADC